MSQRDPIPETYDEWRKLKCPEGCGSDDTCVQSVFQLDRYQYRYHIRNGERFTCTAGSRDAYEAELVAALKGMTREWRLISRDGSWWSNTEESETDPWGENGYIHQSRLVSPWEPEQKEK